MRRGPVRRSSRGLIVPLLAGLVAATMTGTARAGMPVAYRVLTDEAVRRLDAISFFVVLFVASACGIRGMWNRVRRDVPAWPRLSFGGALAVTGLWGLACLVVLTMISGARELLTPGAWQPNGATERLAAAEAPSPQAAGKVEKQARIDRLERLERLRTVLWKHAAQHDGRFPESLGEAVALPEARTTPPPIEMPYRYHAPASPVPGAVPLVSEPDVYDDRLVLLTSGEIVTWQLERPAPGTTP